MTQLDCFSTQVVVHIELTADHSKVGSAGTENGVMDERGPVEGGTFCGSCAVMRSFRETPALGCPIIWRLDKDD